MKIFNDFFCILEPNRKGQGSNKKSLVSEDAFTVI